MEERNKHLKVLSEMLCRYTGRDNIVLSEDSRLAADYNLSSFDLIELIATVEDTFQIQISDQDIRTLTTAGKLCDRIDELKNETRT